MEKRLFDTDLEMAGILLGASATALLLGMHVGLIAGCVGAIGGGALGFMVVRAAQYAAMS